MLVKYKCILCCAELPDDKNKSVDLGSGAGRVCMDPEACQMRRLNTVLFVQRIPDEYPEVFLGKFGIKFQIGHRLLYVGITRVGQCVIMSVGHDHCVVRWVKSDRSFAGLMLALEDEKEGNSPLEESTQIVHFDEIHSCDKLAYEVGFFNLST